MRNLIAPLTIPALTALIGLASQIASDEPAARSADRPEPVAARCLRPEAIDGDTIRCGRQGRRTSHRLLGIDTPELPGHCRSARRVYPDGRIIEPRVCVSGDALASRAVLAAALEPGGVTVQSFGTDLYGRRLSIVRSRGGVNLSCTQLREGQGVYVARWDRGRRILRECGQ
jgi:micrococcal nuclease